MTDLAGNYCSSLSRITFETNLTLRFALRAPRQMKFVDDSEVAYINRGERSEKSYKELNYLYNCCNKNAMEQ